MSQATAAGTIAFIINALFVIAVALCAHYLAQIRDLLRDIRDRKNTATAAPRASAWNRAKN